MKKSPEIIDKILIEFIAKYLKTFELLGDEIGK